MMKNDNFRLSLNNDNLVNIGSYYEDVNDNIQCDCILLWMAFVK